MPSMIGYVRYLGICMGINPGFKIDDAHFISYTGAIDYVNPILLPQIIPYYVWYIFRWNFHINSILIEIGGILIQIQI